MRDSENVNEIGAEIPKIDMLRIKVPRCARRNNEAVYPIRGGQDARPTLRKAWLLVILVLASVIGATSASAGILNTNLVLNGDAETGIGDPSGNSVPSIPGWTTNNGTMTVVQYGASGGFPLLTDPGPANRGTNFFAGGYHGAISSAYQNIDVSSAAALIDARVMSSVLSGWLGGFSSQEDDTVLTATFLDATGTNALGTVSIGPVSAVDRTNNTALLFRQAATAVPPGTRTVQLLLVMTLFEGSFNDGYADNLSFVLETAPRLQIAGTGNSATLTWPTNAAAWHLESTVSTSGGWTNLPGSPATLGTNFVATVSATNHQQFFRLAYP